MSMNASQKGLRSAAACALPSVSGERAPPLQARKSALLPLASLVLAIVLWGANWPVMKVGLAHVTPVWFSALRFGTGGAALFLVQILGGGIRFPKRGDLPFIASIGLLQMAAFTVLGALAMTHLPAGRSAILSYTTPLWVTPISVFVFAEKVSKLRIAGILLAALGVAILVNPSAINWGDPVVLASNAALLVGSICWALCIIHLRYFRSVSSAFVLAPWQMLLATVLLVPLAWSIEGGFTADDTITFFASTIFVGPVATAFCFVAVNAASSWLPATTMSTAMLGVPVTGVLLSLLLLGEPLTAPLAAGTAAIVTGIVMNAIPRRQTNKVEL